MMMVRVWMDLDRNRNRRYEGTYVEVVVTGRRQRHSNITTDVDVS